MSARSDQSPRTIPKTLTSLRAQDVNHIIDLANEYELQRSHQSLSELTPSELIRGPSCYRELVRVIGALSQDQQQELCALMWLGRDNDPADEFQAHMGLARDMHPDYLASKTDLGDYLSSGLETLGFSIDSEGY